MGVQPELGAIRRRVQPIAIGDGNEFNCCSVFDSDLVVNSQTYNSHSNTSRVGDANATPVTGHTDRGSYLGAANITATRNCHSATCHSYAATRDANREADRATASNSDAANVGHGAYMARTFVQCIKPCPGRWNQYDRLGIQAAKALIDSRRPGF